MSNFLQFLKGRELFKKNRKSALPRALTQIRHPLKTLLSYCTYLKHANPIMQICQEKRRSSLENLQFFHESWIDVTEFLIYLIKDKNFKIFQ